MKGLWQQSPYMLLRKIMGSSWTQSSCYNSNTSKKNCQDYSVDKKSRETSTEFRNLEAARMKRISVNMKTLLWHMCVTMFKMTCSNYINLEKVACLMHSFDNS